MTHTEMILEDRRRSRTQFVDREGGFTIEELRKAFEMVHDLDNWKNPIRAEIHPSLLEVTLKAIEFMTGTKATVSGVNGYGRIIVEAPGYYAGPCN